jgi:LPPG:FO 2-phospho-L-lactate transferase
MVAVSGIVGGKALKGPADRMLASLGEEVSSLGVARRFARLLSHFVLDRVDAALESAIRDLGVQTLVTDTIMAGDESRARLAKEILEFATSPTGGPR